MGTLRVEVIVSLEKQADLARVPNTETRCSDVKSQDAHGSDQGRVHSVFDKHVAAH
jgi:hypothetical protein